MALTDVAIRAIKTTGEKQKFSDDGGLQLWVSEKGTKTWRFAYRFHGKQKDVVLGQYPEVGLAEARKKRGEAKTQLAKGIDPGQQKKIDKLTKAIANATTFRAVAEEYLERQAREGRAETTLAKNRYLLELAYPAIGNRPIAEIKAAEIVAILKHLEKRGTLEAAKRVRATIGAVIRYAIATSRAETDPTAALRNAIIAPKVKHRAAITDAVAFGGLLRAIESFDGQPTTKAALRLLPLVFTRPSELRLAEWKEFDLITRRAQSGELPHVAAGSILVRKLPDDGVAVHLESIDRLIRVAIPERSAHHCDVLRRRRDEFFQPRNRVREQDHVLVDLHVESRRAAVVHLLERRRHRGDMVDDVNWPLHSLGREMLHAVGEVHLIANGRDKDRCLGRTHHRTPTGGALPARESRSTC